MSVAPTRPAANSTISEAKARPLSKRTTQEPFFRVSIFVDLLPELQAQAGVDDVVAEVHEDFLVDEIQHGGARLDEA